MSLEPKINSLIHRVSHVRVASNGVWQFRLPNVSQMLCRYAEGYVYSSGRCVAWTCRRVNNWTHSQARINAECIAYRWNASHVCSHYTVIQSRQHFISLARALPPAGLTRKGGLLSVYWDTAAAAIKNSLACTIITPNHVAVRKLAMRLLTPRM